SHLETARPFLAAGRHVIVEKPLEITAARAEALLAEAARTGARVAPVFQARFGPGARRLRTAVDQGRFGRLGLASGYGERPRPAGYYQGWKGTLAQDGGGALINQGIHAADLLAWLAGPVAAVFAWRTRRTHLGIEGEDTVGAVLRYASGALGGLEASTALW